MEVDPQFPAKTPGGGGPGGAGKPQGGGHSWNKDGKPKLGPDGKPIPSDGEHRHWKPPGDSN